MTTQQVGLFGPARQLWPGPELDEAVAKAMGRQIFGTCLVPHKVAYNADRRHGRQTSPYDPSTNVSLALEEADKKFPSYTISKHSRGNMLFIPWRQAGGGGPVGTSAESIAHAICLAIVAAGPWRDTHES